MDIVDKQIPAKLKPIVTPDSFVEKWWQMVDDPRHHFFTAKLPRVSLPALWRLRLTHQGLINPTTADEMTRKGNTANAGCKQG